MSEPGARGAQSRCRATRGWLVGLLLVLVTLQSAWAAAAAYCAHEPDAAAVHPGHHSPMQPVRSGADDATTANAAVIGVDCEACRGSPASLQSSPPALPAAPAASPLRAPRLRMPASAIARLPDRPPWRFSA